MALASHEGRPSAPSGKALSPSAAFEEARSWTLDLVARVSVEDLERVHTEILSPLVWDLGHIAAYEDLWLAHRCGGMPLLRGELAALYDAFETPRAARGDIPLLRCGEVHEYMRAVRARVAGVLDSLDGRTAPLAEMVLRHEQQHGETMLQAMQLAGLEGPSAPEPPGAGRLDPASGLELVEVPAGRCLIGATPDRFAFDNERPRHAVHLRGFSIGRTPITNASYLTFVEGGGYERREWWSQEGWAWKEQYDITRPAGWTEDLRCERRLHRLEPLDPHRPVIHVSWFEADAFARCHGLRLPTESEWEKAATWDQEQERALPHPWGNEPALAGRHANLDCRLDGPARAGSHPAGASPCGCLGMIGDVWEWTASEFGGYPGFRPHPYREYSEVFFHRGYRVLRGASWATRAHAAAATFRNWDLPQRRQIFAGLRVARDA